MTKRDDNAHIAYTKSTNFIYNQFNTVNAIYQKERNSLIPNAEKIAFSAAGPKPTEKGKDEKRLKRLAEWKSLWDRIFLHAMDTMAREKGIIK